MQKCWGYDEIVPMLNPSNSQLVVNSNRKLCTSTEGDYLPVKTNYAKTYSTSLPHKVKHITLQTNTTGKLSMANETVPMPGYYCFAAPYLGNIINQLCTKKKLAPG